MATPMVRRSSNQLGQPKQPRRANPLSLSSRRVAAWVAEITLCAVSGLVPFGIGAYTNTKTDCFCYKYGIASRISVPWIQFFRSW